MNYDDLLNIKLNDLEDDYNSIRKKIKSLRDSYLIETDAQKKFALEQNIEQLEKIRGDRESEITKLTKEVTEISNVEMILNDCGTILRDVSSVLNEVTNTVSKLCAGNERIEILNHALNFGSTWKWFLNDIIRRKEFRNIHYRAMIMNPESDFIKKIISQSNDSVGSLAISPVVDAIEQISNFINSKDGKEKLENRRISIELRVYDLPPVIHGFLISDKYLFLGHTEIHNKKIRGGSSPYRFFDLNQESLIKNHYFTSFKSWFEYIWNEMTKPIF